MTSWKDQNIAEWNRLETYFADHKLVPVVWITANQLLHRNGLIAEFQDRFPSFVHQSSTAWGFDLGEFENMNSFLRSLVNAQLLQSTERPLLLHLPAIARYLPTIADDYRTDFISELQRNLENGFEEWPFTVVIWSEQSVKLRFEKKMVMRKEKEIPHFHFESKEEKGLSAVPAPVHIPVEPFKEQKKWLEIISKFESKKSSAEFSYGDGDQLASAYNTVGDATSEANCRIEMLEKFKDLSQEVRYYQLYRTAQAHDRAGNWEESKNYWEKSNEIFRQLYKVDSSTANLRMGQALSYQGKLKAAQQKIEFAIKLAKQQGDSFIYGICLREQGLFAARNKDYQSAEEFYLSSALVLIEDDEGSQAQYSMELLAVLWMSLERYEEAVLVLLEAYNLFEYNKSGITHRLVQLLDFGIERLGLEREDELLLALFDCGERFQVLRSELRKYQKP